MSVHSTRRLIWVPVIHTEAGLGNMSESVKRLYVQKLGEAKWEEHVRVVELFWKKVEEHIEGLRLDYARVRLYQDGLACCGGEVEIVRSLARAGSLNCVLLLKLMERGARLTGTESPDLLVEEYELARKRVSGEAGPTAAAREALHDRVLDMRDRFIASRIDRTLQQGETGLIFLGLLHSLDRRLPPGMRVSRVRIDMFARGQPAVRDAG